MDSETEEKVARGTGGEQRGAVRRRHPSRLVATASAFEGLTLRTVAEERSKGRKERLSVRMSEPAAECKTSPTPYLPPWHRKASSQLAARVAER